MEVRRPIYVIRLRALPNVDGERALRTVLKMLLRKYGLQCVSAEIEKTNPTGGMND
jgi:hypothetical protein